VFGTSAVFPNGVLPSWKVIVPVGLVKAWPGLTETLFGWTVPVNPTAPPTVIVVGFAVTAVVAPFCPEAMPPMADRDNSRAGKMTR
jgi:hypothetical protein